MKISESKLKKAFRNVGVKQSNFRCDFAKATGVKHSIATGAKHAVSTGVRHSIATA